MVLWHHLEEGNEMEKDWLNYLKQRGVSKIDCVFLALQDLGLLAKFTSDFQLPCTQSSNENTESMLR